MEKRERRKEGKEEEPALRMTAVAQISDPGGEHDITS